MPTKRNLLQNFNQVSNSANKKKNESKKLRKRLQFHSNSNSNNVIVQNKNRKKGGVLNSLPNKFFRSNSNSKSNSNSPMKTISIRKVLNDILNEQEKSKMIDEFLNLQKKLESLKPKNDGTVSNNQKQVITKMKNLLIKINNKK